MRGPGNYLSLPLADLNNSAPDGSSIYQLRHYKWRTFLNILGPSLVLGYYSFVCFYFLASPSVNNIVSFSPVNSR